jgi:hypothetical protein
VIEQRVPAIARWMLYALGAIEGRRVLRPIDGVAAWLLRNHPALLPTVPQSDVLSTIRARTEVVDRMIGEEVLRARSRGETIALWTVGGGFDARWARIWGPFEDVIEHLVEVESPVITELKSQLLKTSPFVEAWSRVLRRGLPEAEWTLDDRGNPVPVVVLETGAGRLDETELRTLLLRIRNDAPRARVIVGLPADQGAEDRRWSRAALAALGWRVDEDVCIAGRGRLQGNNGQELSPGMYAFRVAKIRALGNRGEDPRTEAALDGAADAGPR